MTYARPEAYLLRHSVGPTTICGEHDLLARLIALALVLAPAPAIPRERNVLGDVALDAGRD